MPGSYLRQIHRKMTVVSIFDCWLRSLGGAVAVSALDNLFHWLRYTYGNIHNISYPWEPSEFIIGPVVTFILLLYIQFHDRDLTFAERARLEAIAEMNKRIESAISALIGHFKNGESEELAVAKYATDQIQVVLKDVLPDVAVPLKLFNSRDLRKASSKRLRDVMMILSNIDELKDDITKKTAEASCIRMLQETLAIIDKQ